MNIALDMMGGDFAPIEAVHGVAQYLQQSSTPAHLTLLGDELALLPLLEEHKISAEHISVVHTPEIIGYHEHPVKALKEKQNSSIATGFRMLAMGQTDAFISAGNTGAMLVGSMFSLKTIEGVLRPTIATIMPRISGKTGLLLDVGINSDCARGIADFNRRRGGHGPFEHALELVLETAQVVGVGGRPGGQGDGCFSAGCERGRLLCRRAGRAGKAAGDECGQDDATSGIHA
jgi:hypothetical protein